MQEIITETFNKVKKLLDKDKKYRDNDNTLIVRFWYDELKELKFDAKKRTALDFLILYGIKQLTVEDLILRARRKVNEMYPKTIGKSYKQRAKKDKSKREVYEQITNKVKFLLESDKKYRDNDRTLVIRFWHDELTRINFDCKKKTVLDLLILKGEGSLTSSGSITRERRRINFTHADTIGLSYKPRMVKENDIKKELKIIAKKNKL